MSRALFLVLFTVFIMSGCSGAVKPTDISNPDITVEEFIEDQLLGRGVRNLWMNEATRNNDGSISYKAHFNSTNYSKVTRPYRNLNAFCEAQGGTLFITSHTATVTNLTEPGVSVDQVFRSQQRSYTNLGMQNSRATLAAAYDAEDYRRVIAARYPPQIRQTLQMVEAQGFFGSYICERDNLQIWSALIQPTEFIPSSDPNNQLLTPSIILTVKATTL